MNKKEHSVSKITLSNGLQCILNKDNTKRYAALNIWYHVGSKNEKPGMTGFAHLFEHLMFEGSKNCNTNWFSIVEPISTGINGSTNSDRTNYWENISPEYLERVIFMEADRMGYLTEVLTDTKLEKEKKIVIQEKPIQKFNVLAGIYFINKNSLRNLKPGELDMDELINLMQSKDDSVGYYDLGSKWIDVGNEESLKLAEKFVKSNLFN